MEQMSGGMLELLKYAAVSQMNPVKLASASTSEKSEFGKLLEKKSSETDKTVDASSTGRTETTDRETAKVTDSSEKTETADSTEKTEQPEQDEVCDAAREAACAQIVWIVPQNPVETPDATTEVAVTEVGELSAQLTQGFEESAASGETQTVETEDFTVENPAIAQETGLPPEQPETDVPETAVVEHSESVAEEQPVTEVAKQTEETLPQGEDAEETVNGEAAAETALFQDVETAPIKVAEAPAETKPTTQAETPELKEQVSDQLVKVLESGENRVEIQLQPEALGKLNIALTRSADGTLNVVLRAETEQTRSLLERTMGSLHDILADRGQQNVQIEVNQSEETPRQNDNQQQDLQDGGNGNQQQRRQRQESSSSEDFLQQLRLGLINFGEEQ